MMIYLSIPLPPGLHAKADRAAVVRDIKGQLGRRVVAKRRYRVEFTLLGRWDTKAGDPLERNTDNIVKVLFDAMAEAFEWGKKGRGDNWLDREYSVGAHHHAELEQEIAEISLWPI